MTQEWFVYLNVQMVFRQLGVHCELLHLPSDSASDGTSLSRIARRVNRLSGKWLILVTEPTRVARDLEYARQYERSVLNRDHIVAALGLPLQDLVVFRGNAREVWRQALTPMFFRRMERFHPEQLDEMCNLITPHLAHASAASTHIPLFWILYGRSAYGRVPLMETIRDAHLVANEEFARLNDADGYRRTNRALEPAQEAGRRKRYTADMAYAIAQPLKDE